MYALIDDCTSDGVARGALVFVGEHRRTPDVFVPSYRARRAGHLKPDVGPGAFLALDALPGAAGAVEIVGAQRTFVRCVLKLSRGACVARGFRAARKPPFNALRACFGAAPATRGDAAAATAVAAAAAALQNSTTHHMT